MKITEKQIQHFFWTIKRRLALYDWKLELIRCSAEGYCWMKSKTIQVGLLYPDPRELLIHEIAHIDTARFCNQKHNFIFWRVFADYMRCFLPDVDISEMQKMHSEYATVGRYSIDYQCWLFNKED
jgi:hypothetical protein